MPRHDPARADGGDRERVRSYNELARLTRAGRRDELTDAERDVVGAGRGDAAGLVALGLGLAGLGPIGLVPGIVSVRRSAVGRSSWLGRVGLLLCCVSTAVIVGALVLAVRTG
ncbi:hypothetical protein [Georgenia subflava]|uniref:Uncharacterized protein n=1 Tax=Georgenia subflava TaxID=1622177 RepID=A0A6N7EKU9_9MICO|nr:hypothetical protein [Georgenia subflava]MPV37175.1 hypothetical protein [Georgenia subflava]